MNRPLEIFIVVVYNLILVGGASYLVYYKDASAWLYLIALIFAAGWKDKKEETNVRSI